ncbi:TetR family transcriptional regulator [Fontibacillus phaseoli]|uniref:TetR family transcriptional regulator n=1 Tax=Fontibacillus phaseoli TaxID=1416533 RepID=A0A369B1V5_9BACL|nr:TetR/AcrR family transcriptional regulator [Fontibacillus phaseoli]RCX15401.1 TetR family transcriptional regulator [Fontibacillus phaseoli]
MLTPKGEASKSKLLASAEELFAQKGFHATTVSQIVKNAGLTQAAFYLYFKSKDEILRELLAKFEDQLLPLTDAGRNAAGKTPEELVAYVIHAFTGLFVLLGRNANLTRIALLETESGLSIRDKIVQQICANMVRNQQAGIVRPDVEPELAAESVVASVERLIYRYSATGEKDAAELGRQTAKLFLQGILIRRK